jgi:hypothetical protein
VLLHHDKATAHTADFTQQYLIGLQNRTAMDFIKNEDIPVKSPDTMDFYAFGYLKQRLFRRRATSIPGLWKVLQEEWSYITIDNIRLVFNEWKKRCRAVSRGHGGHIEHIKNIHKRHLLL